MEQLSASKRKHIQAKNLKLKSNARRKKFPLRYIEITMNNFWLNFENILRGKGHKSRNEHMCGVYNIVCAYAHTVVYDY